MATKKKNIYSIAELDMLKRELVGIIDYLQALDLDNISDKIEWVTSANGGLFPRVVSSIENIIETVVGEIKRSAAIIMTVYETEGMTEVMKEQIKVTLEKLTEIQDYFFSQSPKDIRHRILDIEGGINKRTGEVKVIRLVAATEESQIKIRGRVTKNIMEIIPMVDIIKNYNTTSVRGGAEVSYSMMKFEKRRAQQITEENE